MKINIYRKCVNFKLSGITFMGSNISIFYLPSQEVSTLKGKNLHSWNSFWKGCIVLRSKQEVTKVFSLSKKIGGKGGAPTHLKINYLKL